MQALLQPLFASRIASIVKTANCAQRDGRTLEPDERMLLKYDTLDHHTLTEYKPLVKKMIAYKSTRNPKAYRDAFRAIDDACDGLSKLNVEVKGLFLIRTRTN